MRRLKLLLSLVLCVGFLSLGPASVNAKVLWRMQSYMPATSELHQYLQEFCDRLKDETDGEMEITLYPGNALFPNLKVFKNVQSGVVDMAQTVVLYYSGEFPEGAALLPPYGPGRYDDMLQLLYYRGLRDLIQPFYEKQGLMTLGYFHPGAEPIFSRVPIRTMADFKGKKIRMLGSSAKFFTDYLGASTVTLGGGDLFPALSNGTVDAAEFSGGSTDYALGMHRVTKYIIMPTYLQTGFTEFLINKKSYDSLPEKIRKTFDLVVSWAEVHITLKVERDNQIALKKMVEEGGMEVIWLPDEDVEKIHKMAIQFWDDELATISPMTKEIIEMYKTLAKERGLIK
ncbi:MAG: TRAP transporter substrate-binding protein DctP [Desulfobacteraceae bacterium]|jgi:TRAP-type mannitol/chloroaromatic compound transport system substrate-binding protein|nr:TRAP transporter substrate-binding protein DctP [Desulfobacteraceae bacterium]